MKDTLPYFSHDNNARRHPKMKALIAEFGYEGYGRFWALNERIAESSGAYIDISRKVNKLDLANELGLDGEGLDKFLGFLADPEIDLINMNEGKITTDRTSENYNFLAKNREYERDKKQRKKGKDTFPSGNNGIPSGKSCFPEGIPEEKDTNKGKEIKETKINKKENSTAIAVSEKQISQTANKQELTENQNLLFHAAKACFETSEKAKAIMYQDDASAGREVKHLKTIAIRCEKIAPEMPEKFLENILEHFRLMCNGKYHGKMVFTPQNLITPWIWALVIDSLPENNVSPELQKKVRELFK